MSDAIELETPHPLTNDGWMWHDEPELSSVPSHRIADVTRAADGIRTISRMVRNSLGEPDCSGAQPLSRGTEMALLDAVYCLADYVFDNMEGMRETASTIRKYDLERGNG